MRFVITFGIMFAGLGALPAPAAAAEAGPHAEATAEPLATVVVDPRFGTEAGVRSIEGLYATLMLYDGFLHGKLTMIPEDAWWGKALSVAGRALKGVFIDGLLGAYAAVFAHEIFGHGAAAREAGLRPSFVFRLPYQYGFLQLDTPAVGVTLGANTNDPDQALRIVAAGLAANDDTVYWLAAKMARRQGCMAYGDALLLSLSRLTYLPSFARLRTPSGATGDDLEEYMGRLETRFNLVPAAARAALRERTQIGYFASLADPLLWISLYQLAYPYLYRGERELRWPFIPAGALRLWPSVLHDITPLGPELALHVFGYGSGLSADAYVRVVTSGLTSAVGVGARLLSWQALAWLVLGAELDAWLQPQTVFGVAGYFNRPLTFGVNYGVSAEFRVFGPLALSARVAYKTAGYVLGQPLHEGVHGYAGLMLYR